MKFLAVLAMLPLLVLAVAYLWLMVLDIGWRGALTVFGLLAIILLATSAGVWGMRVLMGWGA